MYGLCLRVCVSVCVYMVKHSSRAKGFSCPLGYFPVRSMPLVDHGGLFLGSDNFGLEEMKNKKKREKERTTMVWTGFFKESISSKRESGAALCLSKQTT